MGSSSASDIAVSTVTLSLLGLLLLHAFNPEGVQAGLQPLQQWWDRGQQQAQSTVRQLQAHLCQTWPGKAQPYPAPLSPSPFTRSTASRSHTQAARSDTTSGTYSRCGTLNSFVTVDFLF